MSFIEGAGRLAPLRSLARLAAILLIGHVWVASAAAQVLPLADYPNSPALMHEGKEYRIVRGDLYARVTTTLSFVEHLYDPDVYAKNYTTVAGVVYRLAGNGQKIPVRTRMTEGFEGAATIRDLIGPTRGWTALTLLAPGAPTVPAYVNLFQRILAGKADFIDNRVEPSASIAHGGKTALHAFAVAPTGALYVTKASMETGLAYFRKGDNFYFSGWYYIAKGHPLSIVDLKDPFLPNYPGMRILFTDDLQPRIELKLGDMGERPTYRASALVQMSTKRWVNVRLHYFLSDGPDGQIELWLDGQKIIDAQGKTMPLPDSVYANVELGITSNGPGVITELFVDDIQFSDKPIP